ncbi:hypothetical protein [Bacillus oleivorans]|uniref:hypothetical protein n=1 Tax=Bacillus oleivorans TaxID=1448271 RepID=UPI0015C69AC9|nr:hypothetical protein [Bacillus oleivorans]
MNNRTLMINPFFFLMFGSLLILIQTNSYLLLGVWGSLAILVYVKLGKTGRLFIVTNLLFGVGFSLYLFVITQGLAGIGSPEWHLFLDRLSLAIMLIPFLCISVANKVSFIRFWKGPMWNEFVHFPFIWSGFHKVFFTDCISDKYDYNDAFYRK